MATSAQKVRSESLRTLPDDNIRQILWRFSDRYDLQMLVQSVRDVARGPVAKLVAEGARHSHEWNRAEVGCCRPSTNPASPRFSWIPNRAAISKVQRTWRSR